MEPIQSAEALQKAIVQLEAVQEQERLLLKGQFIEIYDSMKPINLLKSTMAELSSSQHLKDNLLSATVGITSGYLSKKLFEGVSHSPARKLLGTVLMFGVTSVIAKNPVVVRTVTSGLFNLTAKIGLALLHKRTAHSTTEKKADPLQSVTGLKS